MLEVHCNDNVPISDKLSSDMIYVHKGTLKVCLTNQKSLKETDQKFEYLHEGDYIDSIWKRHSDYKDYVIKYIQGEAIEK